MPDLTPRQHWGYTGPDCCSCLQVVMLLLVAMTGTWHGAWLSSRVRVNKDPSSNIMVISVLTEALANIHSQI